MAGKPKTRYARLKGSAWRHRVTGGLSPEAWSLWTRCISYCPDEESDGVIPASMIRAISGGRTSEKAFRAGLAECLSTGVLVQRTDGDYEVRGYLDHNISRDEDAVRRADASSRQRESRGTRDPHGADVTRDMVTTSNAYHASVTGLSQTHDSGLRTQDTDLKQERSPDLVTPARPAAGATLGNPLGGLDTRRRPMTIAGIELELEAAYGAAWLSRYGKRWALDEAAERHSVRAVAKWCSTREDPAEAAREVVAGAFATPRYTPRKVPWAWMAEDGGPATLAATGRLALARARVEPVLGGGETVEDLARDLRAGGA